MFSSFCCLGDDLFFLAKKRWKTRKEIRADFSFFLPFEPCSFLLAPPFLFSKEKVGRREKLFFNSFFQSSHALFFWPPFLFSKEKGGRRERLLFSFSFQSSHALFFWPPFLFSKEKGGRRERLLFSFSFQSSHDLFFWSYLFFLVKKRWEGEKSYFLTPSPIRAKHFSFGPTFSF